MDETLLKKIEQKIQDSISNKDEIKQLIKSLSLIDDSKSFALGIVVGRIYNAFYYQSKRILNRERTYKIKQKIVFSNHDFFAVKSDFPNCRWGGRSRFSLENVMDWACPGLSRFDEENDSLQIDKNQKTIFGERMPVIKRVNWHNLKHAP